MGVKHEIDLQVFCLPEDDDTRYPAMQCPFVIGKWKYASDERIIVRVPTDEMETPALHEKSGKRLFPKADELPWRHNEFTNWTPWPDVQLEIGTASCTTCNGCGGFDICPHCGEAKRRCDDCGGSGDEKRPCLQVIGAFCIDEVYDAKIRALPDVQFVLTNPVAKKAHVLFRFTGGEGIVMPKLRDNEV